MPSLRSVNGLQRLGLIDQNEIHPENYQQIQIYNKIYPLADVFGQYLPENKVAKAKDHLIDTIKILPDKFPGDVQILPQWQHITVGYEARLGMILAKESSLFTPGYLEYAAIHSLGNLRMPIQRMVVQHPTAAHAVMSYHNNRFMHWGAADETELTLLKLVHFIPLIFQEGMLRKTGLGYKLGNLAIEQNGLQTIYEHTNY